MAVAVMLSSGPQPDRVQYGGQEGWLQRAAPGSVLSLRSWAVSS